MTDRSPDGAQPSSEVKRLRRLIGGWKLLFFLPVVALALLMAGYGHYTDPGPLPEAEVLVIPHGDTKKIVRFLQEKDVLTSGRVSSFFFRVMTLLTAREGQIHAAELTFPSRVSMAHVLDILRHGKPVSHHLTIPEGLTVRQIKALLDKAPALQGNSPDFAEGTVFPQTINYVWGTQRDAVIRRLQVMMDEHLRTIWQGRDRQALQGVVSSPQDLLVLASLVERETALSSERSMVARVFLNRLRRNMRLQTDASVIYGLSHGWGTLEAPLTHDDLDTEDPYNTYLKAGLPPGPICSPGLASLTAAAHPAEGKMLYFVATGHGGHRFADTLSEQDRNIRSYRRELSPPGR